MYSLIHPRDTALDSPVQTGPVRVQEIDQVLELQVAGHPHILVHSVICCVPVGQRTGSVRLRWEFYAPDAVRLGSAVTSLRILRRICWWLDPPLSR